MGLHLVRCYSKQAHALARTGRAAAKALQLPFIFSLLELFFLSKRQINPIALAMGDCWEPGMLSNSWVGWGKGMRESVKIGKRRDEFF